MRLARGEWKGAKVEQIEWHKFGDWRWLRCKLLNCWQRSTCLLTEAHSTRIVRTFLWLSKWSPEIHQHYRQDVMKFTLVLGDIMLCLLMAGIYYNSSRCPFVNNNRFISEIVFSSPHISFIVDTKSPPHTQWEFQFLSPTSPGLIIKAFTFHIYTNIGLLKKKWNVTFWRTNYTFDIICTYMKCLVKCRFDWINWSNLLEYSSNRNRIN